MFFAETAASRNTISSRFVMSVRLKLTVPQSGRLMHSAAMTSSEIRCSACFRTHLQFTSYLCLCGQKLPWKLYRTAGPPGEGFIQVLGQQRAKHLQAGGVLPDPQGHAQHLHAMHFTC